MNRRLSQGKARACAIEALIRYLGGEKEQTATIRHLEIVESRVVDSGFVLNVRIPRKRVTLTKISKFQPASQPYLVRNRLLMEVTGAKIIKLKDRKTILWSAASTVPKDDSAKERFRANRSAGRRLLRVSSRKRKGFRHN